MADRQQWISEWRAQRNAEEAAVWIAQWRDGLAISCQWPRQNVVGNSCQWPGQNLEAVSCQWPRQVAEAIACQWPRQNVDAISCQWPRQNLSKPLEEYDLEAAKARALDAELWIGRWALQQWKARAAPLCDLGKRDVANNISYIPTKKKEEKSRFAKFERFFKKQ